MLELRSPSPTPSESWIAPDGARYKRHLLGSCLHGKLFLRPSSKTNATDLLWVGHNVSGALDWILRQTTKPIPTSRANIFWLARLPSPLNSYLVADKLGGGQELFELSKCWITRPGRQRW